MPGLKSKPKKEKSMKEKKISKKVAKQVEEQRPLVEKVEPRYVEPKFEDPMIDIQSQQSNPMEIVENIFDSSDFSIQFDNSIERFHAMNCSTAITAPYMDKLPVKDESNLDNMIRSVLQADVPPIEQVVQRPTPNQLEFQIPQPDIYNLPRQAKRKIEMEVL